MAFSFDLTKASMRIYWLGLAAFALLVTSNRAFYHAHFVASPAPLGTSSPTWFRILGLTQYALLLCLIGVFVSTIYNSILISSSNSSDGDPVQMRSPLLWGKLLQCLVGAGLLIGLLMMLDKF
jgi:hypothetical protein